METKPFCRYCQDPLPTSSKPEKCLTCKNVSVPLTEKGISIPPKEVKKKLDKGEDFLFIDVRWPYERDIAVMYRRNKPQSGPMAAFLDLLGEIYGMKLPR